MVGSLRGKYLNYLARLELIIKGNKLSIDLCALHSVADLGVDCVGKVDYGCARRQGYDIALGSECENILGSKVALDGADNFLNIVGFLLGFNYLAYPCQSVLQLILSLYALLVFPVGCDTVFSGVVHINSSYLHLKGDTLSADNGGVQGLIHICLGGCDVVFEAVGYGLEHIVDYTQRIVALVYSVDYNAHGVNIIHFIKTLALDERFSVNAVNRFYTSRHLRLGQTHFHKALCDLLLDGVDECLTLVTAYFKHLLYFGICVGVKVPERQIFYLVLDSPDTETVSYGRIDVHGLQSCVPLLVCGTELERSHIVEAVAELYYDNSDILRHGKEDFSYVLCLLFLFGEKGYLAQLCNAVNQHCHVLAEKLSQLFKGGVRILHNVVEKSGTDSIRIHT